MKKIREIAQKNLIIEFSFIVFIIFVFDFIFIMRYGFGVTFAHWIVAFFNVALVLSALTFIRSNKRRFRSYLLYILIMFSFFVSDSTLYYYKKDVTSIAMLLESGKNTMKIGIKYNPLTPYGIIIWLMIISFVVFAIITLKKIVNLHDDLTPKRYVKRTAVLITSMLGLAMSPIIINANDYLTYTTPADKSLFVQKFGSITYHSKDIVTFANNAIKPLLYADEYAEIIDSQITYTIAEKSPYFGLLEGQNVIMIMCETCEEYAFDREYTPNYYRLVDDGLYFTNFYSAAKNNYTYDAEFKSLTSMMYFQADNFMYTFGNNLYLNAIPHVLLEHGFCTASFHDYYLDFFNRDVIHPNLGFENFYAYENLEYEEETFWPLDSIMFDQFKELIAPVQEDPFFSFVITVTPHGTHNEYRDELKPFYDLLDADPNYQDREQEFKTLMAAQMNFDLGLGYLLDHLEENNLMDSTTIILFSDHKNYSSYPITEKYTENSDIPYEVEKVPMIIRSSLIPAGQNDVLSSHYDITPTIMDLMGISYYQDFYYGQSLFLENRIDLPIILSYSSWISHQMTVEFEEIVAGETDEELFQETRLWVYDVIDRYEKMFQSDFFRDQETYIKNNES